MSSHFVITEHRVELELYFDWNNVEILDEKPYYYKWLVLEKLHIKKQKNSLNLN